MILTFSEWGAMVPSGTLKGSWDGALGQMVTLRIPFIKDFRSFGKDTRTQETLDEALFEEHHFRVRRVVEPESENPFNAPDGT